MFLYMAGFLVSLNKTKYDWISLEYTRVCLIYKDTVKLL